MFVSRSIVCASIKTARAKPSTRPASSSKSLCSMVLSKCVVAMARLCQPARPLPMPKLANCLEAHVKGSF